MGNDYILHKSRKIGDVINVFTYNLTKSVSFLNYFLNFIVATASFTFLTTFIIFKNPLVTLGTVFTVGLAYIFIALNYKSRIVRDGKTIKFTLDQITNIIQELTRDIENTLLNYKDRSLIKFYSEKDKIYKNKNAKVLNYNTLPKHIIEGVGLTSFGFFG